ncbi:MAG: hypothetical protein HN884_02210 [Rhodospirillaceae bacterium]|jgi:hypothetical protein|nr:hypothetical protein [Rhodospirillaceae bacterium]MBT4589528.1 hypothetical protein [Rhodospirillaceae bacterium]MBT7265661.1 hypothetical protein [Rhodospirillaceae bacterium]
MTQYDDPQDDSKDDSVADNAAIKFNSDPTLGDLIYLGLDEVAYIKPIVENGEDIYGIFAADGEQIGMAPEFELARAMTIQSELYPVNVH